MGQRISQVGLEVAVKTVQDIRLSQTLVEVAATYSPDARLTASILEVSVTKDREARVNDLVLEVLVPLVEAVSGYISTSLVITLPPTSVTIERSWPGWGNPITRPFQSDLKQVHRRLGINESEKINKIIKTGQTDVQTGIIQSKFIDYFTKIYSNNSKESIDSNLRLIQKYRFHITWRIKG